MLKDAKSAPGKSARKTGQLYFGDLRERCGCVVWSLAGSEAVGEVNASTSLPDRLRLISAALTIDKSCDVVWRDGRKFGLRFAT